MRSEYLFMLRRLVYVRCWCFGRDPEGNNDSLPTQKLGLDRVA